MSTAPIPLPSFAEASAIGRQRQDALLKELREKIVAETNAVHIGFGTSFRIIAPHGLERESMRDVVAELTRRGWVKAGFYQLVTGEEAPDPNLPELFLSFEAPPA